MTRWYQQKKQEHYYKTAKRVGYRARSAFKLQQILKRFSLLSSGDIVLDLGAAPGGWSQVALEYVGDQGKVIGVDLQPIKPLSGATFLQGDFTHPSTQDALRELLESRPADVVLSDMSPDISGTYSLDQARSVYLCEQALVCCDSLLKVGGHFVCKVFEGEDTAQLLDQVRRRFYIVKTFSPKASRKSSSEIYLVAKRRKGAIEK